MTPKVSVVMAAYNREKYIATAIESVLAQEMGDFELLIGDNQSTDRTGDIARSYAERDPRVKYHYNAQHGSAVENFNLCYQRSDPRSEYVAVLATDDWWEPPFLGRLTAILDRHPDVSFAYADMYCTDAEGTPIVRYSDIYDDVILAGPHQRVRELYDGCYVNIMAAVIRRSDLKRLLATEELFDASLRLTPDYNLWLQFMTRGAVAYSNPEVLAYYRKHDDAMTMAINDLPRLQEEIVIFREKLQGICDGEMEPWRQEALSVRLAEIGFQLLRSGKTSEARAAFKETESYVSRSRRDLTVARTIAGLPLPSRFQSGLWQMLLSGAAAMKRL